MLGVQVILSVKKHLLQCQLHNISKESGTFEVSLSVCLRKHHNPAICFAPNNQFLSQNNKNIRGAVIKATLIV